MAFRHTARLSNTHSILVNADTPSLNLDPNIFIAMAVVEVEEPGVRLVS